MPDLSTRTVSLACGPYLLRTLTPADASERWACWMRDPGNLRLLNSAPNAMTRDDVVTYIKRFDQKSHLLIGIFHQRNGLHIGFFRLDIDHRLNRCLLFLLIGEQKYRHWRVTHAFRVPFVDYIFDELGLNAQKSNTARKAAMPRAML